MAMAPIVDGEAQVEEKVFKGPFKMSSVFLAIQNLVDANDAMILVKGDSSSRQFQISDDSIEINVHIRKEDNRVVEVIVTSNSVPSQNELVFKSFEVLEVLKAG